MATQFNEQMQALFAEQQALFKQWLEQTTQAPETQGFGGPDQAKIAATLATQSAEFLQLGNQLLTLLQSMPGKDALNSAFNQFRDYIQHHTGEALLQQWRLPEHLSALFRTHSFHDDQFFENPFLSGLKTLLDAPSVGASHVWQQDVRDGMRLLLNYQEALSEYIGHYTSINEQAVDQLLSELTDGDKTVETLGELHDLWVECYESAYAKTLYTPEYQQSHGKISNIIMQLRSYYQEIRDRQFATAGLATRKGLDTALERQHALRKGMRKVDQRLAQLENQLQHLETLEAKIATLEAKVQHLQAPKSSAKKSGAV